MNYTVSDIQEMTNKEYIEYIKSQDIKKGTIAECVEDAWKANFRFIGRINGEEVEDYRVELIEDDEGFVFKHLGIDNVNFGSHYEFLEDLIKNELLEERNVENFRVIVLN